jgi:hypothetical protein
VSKSYSEETPMKIAAAILFKIALIMAFLVINWRLDTILEATKETRIVVVELIRQK